MLKVATSVNAHIRRLAVTAYPPEYDDAQPIKNAGRRRRLIHQAHDAINA